MLPGAAEIGAQTGLPLQMNSDMRTCLHVIKIDFVYKRICPPLCTNFKLCQNLKLLKLGMHVHLDKIQVLSNLARVITLATEWIKLCPLFNLEKKRSIGVCSATLISMYIFYGNTDNLFNVVIYLS
jgi:hypothetical protein